MNKQTKQLVPDGVGRVINTLLLNSSFVDNPGIAHGKMGIAVAFYHLARKTGNQIFESYAGELIDELYDEITVTTPPDFENGLAGIGWGIEYLVQTGFLEADTDEVLEETDHRVMQALIYNTPAAIGLLDGLIGLGFYLVKRLQNPAAGNNKIPTLNLRQMVIHLIDELERKITKGTSFILHEPQQFDLVWDYPLLLWMLADIYDLDIYNSKVSLLLKKVVTPLHDKLNLPKNPGNSLLLLVAIERLSKCDLHKWIDNLSEHNNWKSLLIETADDLHGQLSNTDFREIGDTNAFSLRYGLTGIFLLYQQLYKDTDDDRCLKFAEQLKIIIEQKITNHPDEYFYNSRLGVLEGIGTLLLLER